MISTTLPVELLETILALAIELHPCPSHILCVDSTFRDIGNYILYTRLHFHTLRQLLLFSWRNEAVIPHQPRELRVTLAGGASTHNAFLYLGGVLRKCLDDRSSTSWTASSASHTNTYEDLPLSALPLDVLSLRLNSHVNNPNLKDIYEVLILANPKAFSWFGPDPGHHFSTAVVPEATHHLFRAISTWTRVERVTVTNISFPSEPLDGRDQSLPVLSHLRYLYLGQATFLSPSLIAAIVLQGFEGPRKKHSSRLEEIRLVDAYQESIWGKRLRRADVEKAALALPTSKNCETDAVLERVRSIVRCEAMNERIMGGDRSEGLVALE